MTHVLDPLPGIVIFVAVEPAVSISYVVLPLSIIVGSVGPSTFADSVALSFYGLSFVGSFLGPLHKPLILLNVLLIDLRILIGGRQPQVLNDLRLRRCEIILEFEHVWLQADVVTTVWTRAISIRRWCLVWMSRRHFHLHSLSVRHQVVAFIIIVFAHRTTRFSSRHWIRLKNI